MNCVSKFAPYPYEFGHVIFGKIRMCKKLKGNWKPFPNKCVVATLPLDSYEP